METERRYPGPVEVLKHRAGGFQPSGAEPTLAGFCQSARTRMANQLMKRDPSLTPEQAEADVLKSREGAELYNLESLRHLRDLPVSKAVAEIRKAQPRYFDELASRCGL